MNNLTHKSARLVEEAMSHLNHSPIVQANYRMDSNGNVVGFDVITEGGCLYDVKLNDFETPVATLVRDYSEKASPYSIPLYFDESQTPITYRSQVVAYVKRTANDVYGNPMYCIQFFDGGTERQELHDYVMKASRPPARITRRYKAKMSATMQSYNIRQDLEDLMKEAYREMNISASLDNLDRVVVEHFDSVVADCPVCQEGILQRGQHFYECPECLGTGRTKFILKSQHEGYVKRLSDDEIINWTPNKI